MGILLLGGLVLLVSAVCLLAIRIVQFVSLIAVLVAIACAAVIGYLSIAIGGITLALLYETLGSRHFGLALAISITVGLLSAGLILKTIIRELTTFPQRLKTWFGKEPRKYPME